MKLKIIPKTDNKEEASKQFLMLDELKELNKKQDLINKNLTKNLKKHKWIIYALIFSNLLIPALSYVYKEEIQEFINLTFKQL